jgi:hypothetical protein
MTVIKFDPNIQYPSWELDELTYDMAHAKETPALTQRKLYIQEVTSCTDCPASLINTFLPAVSGECWLAERLGGCLSRKIDNLKEIPDWCPLENAEKAGDPLAP